tara:strand:- start:197 stop:391 length:195 start_codon:yes stop_codon:yes gene_type:complete
MTWKILDNDEGKMEEKITVEQVVEAISRLDSKDLAKLGDELAIRKLAERVAFICEVSMREQDEL